MILLVIFYVKFFLFVHKNAMIVTDRNNENDTETNTPVSENANGPGTRKENAKYEIGKRNRVESKITQNMLVVIICFFVCNVPLSVTFLPRVLLSPTATWYLYAIFSLHCCLNPLIYAWKHPVFRQVFRCMLSRDLRAVEQPSRWLRERITSGWNTSLEMKEASYPIIRRPCMWKWYLYHASFVLSFRDFTYCCLCLPHFWTWPRLERICVYV